MNNSGEAADQVVRMYLNGIEVAAKLTGEASKQVAVLLYAVLKGEKQTKGKARLTSMLRSGKELKVFAVQDADLEKFCKAAKEYGVLYCVLKNKNAKDGVTDIMVRAEDASKINRIYERFKLATVDRASLKTEIVRAKEARKEEPAKQNNPEQEIAETPKTPEDELLDRLLGVETERKENPTQGAQQQKPPQNETPSATLFEPSKETKAHLLGDRTSVREEIRRIKEQRQQAAKLPGLEQAGKNIPEPKIKIKIPKGKER